VQPKVAIVSSGCIFFPFFFWLIEYSTHFAKDQMHHPCVCLERKIIIIIMITLV
jgi:hypothetical protein